VKQTTKLFTALNCLEHFPIVAVVTTGPPTPTVRGQTSNGCWHLSLSSVTLHGAT